MNLRDELDALHHRLNEVAIKVELLEVKLNEQTPAPKRPSKAAKAAAE